MAYTFDPRFLEIPKCSSSQQPAEAQQQKLDELLAFIWSGQDQAAIKAQLLELVSAV